MARHPDNCMCTGCRNWRDEALRALRLAADGYQCAAATLWDLVEGRKPVTLDSLDEAKSMIYGCESQGQNALSRARSILEGSATAPGYAR